MFIYAYIEHHHSRKLLSTNDGNALCYLIAAGLYSSTTCTNGVPASSPCGNNGNGNSVITCSGDQTEIVSINLQNTIGGIYL